MNKEKAVEIAQDTVVIMDKKGYEAPSGTWCDIEDMMRESRDNTQLYTPEELQAMLRLAPGGAIAKVEVTGETTIQAMQRLAQEGTVCGLNFASARKPGGGWLNGAMAQEESLARSSGLYHCLDKPEVAEYYRANRKAEVFYTDHMIYSYAVPFFKDDDGNLLEEPFRASIITAPAPNAAEILKDPFADETSRDILYVILRRRAAMIRAIARDMKERRLVLGAWGCGVFGNDPRDVAKIFHEFVDRSPGLFDRIVFAVYDTSPDQSTLKAFQSEFFPVLHSPS